MGIALMKKFTAVQFSNVSHTFGSTTTSKILQTIETFPDSVAQITSLANSGTYLPEYDPGLTHDVTFLCPLPISESTVFDGPAYGCVTAGAYSASDHPVYINEIDVDIMIIDSAGNATSMIGGATNILLSEFHATNETLKRTTPFWVNIDNVKLSKTERVAFNVKVYSYDDWHWNSLKSYLYFNPANDETYFELPVVVSGD